MGSPLAGERAGEIEEVRGGGCSSCICRLVLLSPLDQRTFSARFRSFSVLSEARVRVPSLTCWIFT